MTDASGNGGGAPPIASKSVVRGELRRALRSGYRNAGSSVLLLRAAPEWHDEPEFTVDIDGSQVPVAAVACPTVLAVLDALAADRDRSRYLVVLTPCETDQVGDWVLARAMRSEVKPINRWDLVQDAFGTRRLDPALTTSANRWIAEGLLDAQPAGGWRRLAGTVLTQSIALNRLAAARLGMDAVADDSGVDAAALLDWTTDPAAVAGFLALRDTERDGIEKWLREETAKRVADVVFAMRPAGKITDAVPFGLVTAALSGREDTLTAWVRAEERYLAGRSLPRDTLREFGEAAESLVTRWMDNGHAPRAAAVCERAEVILADLGGGPAAGESTVLEAGLDARFAALAEAISAALSGPALSEPALSEPALSGPAPDVLAPAEAALARVQQHGRRSEHEPELRAAHDAVRLARWLAVPEAPPATPADGAIRMLRSWAWADRALATVCRADTSRVPRLERAYRGLWTRAKERRAGLDEAFARTLAAGDGPDRPLHAESILERIARPVARQRLPVVVVLDGMTAAAGCELAEEITRGGRWLEAGRRADGREPALATVGSAASISRGFAAFWGRRTSRLFHQGDLAPEPGRPLGGAVRDAIADPDVAVGIAGATIDDRLTQVLDEARRASRPVILTGGPSPSDPPAAGAVVPVITVVPVVTVVPVITLLPSQSLVPPGWYGYDADGHAPSWWTAPLRDRRQPPPAAEPARNAPQPARKKKRAQAPEPEGDALFAIGEAISPGTGSPGVGISLGARVAASPRFASQRRFVRRAPDDASVAALIDALDRAGGRLTRTEAAEAAGVPPVRMSGYLSTVIRLLNMDGYPVLQEKDDGRTVELNPRLLGQQFLGE